MTTNVTAKIRGDGSNVRMEIDDFCQNEDMLNLYLLALARMQANNPENLKGLWSWFGLGRIHGGVNMPHNGVANTALYKVLKSTGRDWQRKAWDRYQTLDKPTTGRGMGYCTHGSVLL